MHWEPCRHFYPQACQWKTLFQVFSRTAMDVCVIRKTAVKECETFVGMRPLTSSWTSAAKARSWRNFDVIIGHTHLTFVVSERQATIWLVVVIWTLFYHRTVRHRQEVGDPSCCIRTIAPAVIDDVALSLSRLFIDYKTMAGATFPLISSLSCYIALFFLWPGREKSVHSGRLVEFLHLMCCNLWRLQKV